MGAAARCGGPEDSRDPVLVQLLRKLVREARWSSLRAPRWGGSQVPARKHNLVYGPCQLGKGEEIARIAWRGAFVDGLVPYIFLKNFGGLEAAMQMRDHIERWNKGVDDALQDIGILDPTEQNKYHLVVRMLTERFAADSQDKQLREGSELSSDKESVLSI